MKNLESTRTGAFTTNKRFWNFTGKFVGAHSSYAKLDAICACIAFRWCVNLCSSAFFSLAYTSVCLFVFLRAEEGEEVWSRAEIYKP